MFAYAASYSARDIPAPPKLLTALGGALGGPRPFELGTELVGGAYSAGFGTFLGLQGSFVGLGLPVDVPGGGGGGFWPFFQVGGYGMTGLFAAGLDGAGFFASTCFAGAAFVSSFFSLLRALFVLTPDATVAFAY